MADVAWQTSAQYQLRIEQYEKISECVEDQKSGNRKQKKIKRQNKLKQISCFKIHLQLQTRDSWRNKFTFTPQKCIWRVHFTQHNAKLYVVQTVLTLSLLEAVINRYCTYWIWKGVGSTAKDVSGINKYMRGRYLLTRKRLNDTRDFKRSNGDVIPRKIWRGLCT